MSERHLLFVDDETFLCVLFRIGLKQRGITVVTAENGKDALALIEADTDNKIAVLFTDINLNSEISGWELIDRARVLRPDLTVMVLTAEADNDAFGKEKVASGHISNFFDKISANQAEMFDACEAALAQKK